MGRRRLGTDKAKCFSFSVLILFQGPLVESSPLTKEQVQQCQEELKAYYRMSQRKVTLDPLMFILLGQFELDEIYTNLSLIDISTMRKAPITYSELLTNDESGNLSKRILIQGEAGVGKSTLCAKIAFDWCKGGILQDLDLVLVFPLRIVTNVETIGDIVKRYLSDSVGATAKQINNYISSNPIKVLIVFDGFDEFNGTLSDENKSEVLRILGLEQYKSVKVIVTTRPWRTDEFKSEKSLREAYSFISIEGFNKKNLLTYIKNYFGMREKETLAEDLISFMEESGVIRTNMAPFPIYCAMLCLMWNNLSEEGRKEMQQLRSFSNVFREIISFLKEHYASIFCDNAQNYNEAEYVNEAHRAIQDITEIALNGLLQRNLSFPKEQFRQCWEAMEICSRVGVLTMERDIFSRDRRLDGNVPTFLEVSTVRFPHKLLQEYIAGMHMAMLFVNDRSKYHKVKSQVLSRYKEFRYLLCFTSALGTELCLDIINDLKKTNDRYICVDVAFECHTEEAARTVGERWEEYKLVSYTPEYTKSGIVFMVHCDQVKSLYIDLLNCGRTLSRDLAEGMCSSRVLQEVTIGDSEFHTDFYKVLSEKASICQIRELDMRFYRDCISEPLVATNLANFLCCLPHLERATLNFRKVPKIFLTTIASKDRRWKTEDITINEKSLSELLGDI
ncbi:NLR family CARD domain-containing protein 4-like [Diadema setosum]|uniref:NLR family CARD domain-containing protein 4-like n=1 Tax=Diadema setosum TaxID=31175 RepID=UPI003B3A44E5